MILIVVEIGLWWLWLLLIGKVSVHLNRLAFLSLVAWTWNNLAVYILDYVFVYIFVIKVSVVFE